jgi:hypothetical protein
MTERQADLVPSELNELGVCYETQCMPRLLCMQHCSEQVAKAVSFAVKVSRCADVRDCSPVTPEPVAVQQAETHLQTCLRTCGFAAPDKLVVEPPKRVPDPRAAWNLSQGGAGTATSASGARATPRRVGLASESFEDAWPTIQATIRQRKTDTLVAPKLGLLALIPFSNSSVAVGEYKNFSDAFAKSGGPPNLDHCELTEGTPPVYDCEWTDRNAPNCIFSTSSSLDAAGRYENAFQEPGLTEGEPSKEAIAELERRDQLVSASVTDVTQKFAWFFGIVDGQWRLIAVRRLDYCPVNRE